MPRIAAAHHHHQPNPNERPTATVRAGDTMSGIARRHRVTTAALIEANPQVRNPSLIHPGQVLNLPQTEAAAPNTPPTPAPRPEAPSDEVGRVWTQFRGISNGRTMRRGSVGEDVKQLQDALVSLGHLSPRDRATGPGIFGPRTDAAVRRFQADRNLSVDGIAGPQTRAELGRMLSGNSRPERQPAPGIPPRTAQPETPNRPQHGRRYDGRNAAEGTTSTRAHVPVDAPYQNAPGERSSDAYNQALNQFAVGNNPRYARRNGNTYCNIFAWDATKAMGAEIPHWVDRNMNKAGVAAPGAWEMDANSVSNWLDRKGAENGWRQVSAAEAQVAANRGEPTLASWKNPGGIGHIGMIRPGVLTNRGPALAQAGSRNFNDGHVADGFGRAQPEYWTHS
jgi:peptidoglycan hydrolase-like protein with peptidoglycan-binding domain